MKSVLKESVKVNVKKLVEELIAKNKRLNETGAIKLYPLVSENFFDKDSSYMEEVLNLVEKSTTKINSDIFFDLANTIYMSEDKLVSIAEYLYSNGFIAKARESEQNLNFNETLVEAYQYYVYDILNSNTRLIDKNIAIDYINKNYSNTLSLTSCEVSLILEKLENVCYSNYNELIEELEKIILDVKFNVVTDIMLKITDVILDMIKLNLEKRGSNKLENIIKCYCREFNLNTDVILEEVENHFSIESFENSIEQQSQLATIFALNLFDLSDSANEVKIKLEERKELLKTIEIEHIIYDVFCS